MPLSVQALAPKDRRSICIQLCCRLVSKISMTDFEIKITRDQSEVREAQRLRFEVFNLQMKKGLQASYQRGLDVDDYDPLCDHLIVRDLRSKRVVGTYRLLLGSIARRRFGFYSEKLFNLEKINSLKGEVLELGRTCAHRDCRDKALIPVMWQAIAEYVKNHQVRYLFGCASLYTADPLEVGKFFALLKGRYYAAEEFRVYPVPEKAFPQLHERAKIADERELFFRLPSLIKSYLRVGAILCGPPALDREFGTTDLFLLLDITKMSSEYLRRFGFSVSKVRRALG